MSATLSSNATIMEPSGSKSTSKVRHKEHQTVWRVWTVAAIAPRGRGQAIILRVALTSGTKLGPYEIVVPIGAGGMGEVYRARDTRLDRIVAIKVLNSQLVASAESRARFEREARVISQLQHPNICVLHDVGREGAIEYLVMEFLEGESLADRLRKGPLATEELLRVAIQIADALEKAHRAGVVHRDLKPGNVMLTKSGAKLLDFGLAKPPGNTSAAGSASGTSASVFAAALTQTSPAQSPASPLSTAGAVIGTVQYMSPEPVSDTCGRSRRLLQRTLVRIC